MTMRPTHATPGRPLRAGIYHRVSTEEQVEGYSLDAQQRATSAFCQAHGWPIARAYGDEGKSARTDDLAKRPAFQQMLADAEAGLIDVIVVHKLDRAGVGFVSISEQMDFTTPIGKVILATLAAFAQYYSDNLATEVRKGKQERKAQGLYNGLIPFGLKKSREGLPVPNPDSYPGLLLAFRLAAEGKCDRDVAGALNAAGHRTTGNRGRNPFTKDTVCRMLQNHFYLGQLPDGEGGWVPAAHDAVLDEELFDRAQQARAANAKAAGALSVPRAKRTHSLSGLLTCGRCGGRLHVETKASGKTRVYCYQRSQTDRCRQRSAPLELIEEQIAAYLATFTLPEETVREVAALYERAHEQRDDTERLRREAKARLERIRELYKWGDMTREAYRAERDHLEAEILALRGTTNRASLVAQAAAFLRDLPAAWDAAMPEQRNALARLVFQSVEVTDGIVTAITPTADFAPFFNVASDDDTGYPGGGVNGEAEGAEAIPVASAS